jgi:outer membrane protein assembly factor BamE (lipoprotein component of BamABCDE complex)
MRILSLLALLLGLAAAGCASYDGHSLRPGMSTEAEVRAVMGQPAAEFRDSDGTRRLVYPRGPLGTQTYVADVDANGVLAALRPVLSDDTFNRIQPGMTRDDILRMIGPPGETMAFPLSGQVAWDYRYVDTWGYPAIFSVAFDKNGVVVSKFTRRVERDRGRM